MRELLVGTTVSPTGSIASRGSTPSVETFPGSPESQVSPPGISDTQPAVLQPMTHQMPGFGNGMNHGDLANSHTQAINGFYQAPAAVPQRTTANGVFQPAMSSTPEIVGRTQNGFQLVNHQFVPWTSQRHMNVSPRGQSVVIDQGGSQFVANGESYDCESISSQICVGTEMRHLL